MGVVEKTGNEIKRVKKKVVGRPFRGIEGSYIDRQLQRENNRERRKWSNRQNMR